MGDQMLTYLCTDCGAYKEEERPAVRPEATALDGEVMLSIPETLHGDANRMMSTRDAFSLVTDLLTAIDQARAFGEHRRGEVANPDRHKNRKRA
jgi:hypothetical protein